MCDSKTLSKLKVTVLAEDSVLYESPFLGQHGVSFLVSATRGNIVKHVLVDVGQNPDALLHNMSLMDIAPSTIDAIVLTHCHYDHTRGVTRIIGEVNRSGIPVIAHPDLFRLNFVTDPYLRHVGVMPGDSRAAIEKAGGLLHLTQDPLEILPGLVTTGEVPRMSDFEEVGMGLCTIRDTTVETDMMRDDISIVANIEVKGLCIVTGCSHAGIVNIVRHAVTLTNTDRIEGIIGGLHLIEASVDRIQRTAVELKELNPSWISAGHCTGFMAQVALHTALGERFRPLHTGMVFDV
jgi:7,8-dihydropterin-6-yl-methyl-4-(beta-D-ribofuranosyl)aminobenzene 5'-phosphate synthase